MKTAFKELIFFKKKYLLIELLVVLMMFMVTFLSGLSNGLARAVSASVETMNATNFILSDDAEGVMTYSNLTNSLQDKIDHLGLSSQASLNIGRSNIKIEKHALDITYFSVDSDSFLAPTLISGHSFSKNMTIVLDKSFKDGGIKLGDVVTDKSSGLELTVVGFTKDQLYGHTSAGYISKNTWKTLYQKNNPQYLWQPQAIATQDNKVKKVGEQLAVWSKSDLIKKIPGYSAEQSTLQMILWVLVVASAAILGVFFYIITLEKRQEFGVMKAIGMKMSEIARIQLAQSVILSIFGVIVGDGLAYVISLFLPVSMPFYLKFENLAGVSLAFIAICLGASIFSILKVSKIDPIEIVNGGDI